MPLKQMIIIMTAIVIYNKKNSILASVRTTSIIRITVTVNIIIITTILIITTIFIIGREVSIGIL